MPDRCVQIQQLISSRFDHILQPRGHLRTASGLAPIERVPCPTCAHHSRPGWLPVKRNGVVKSWQPCLACGGVLAGENTKAKKGAGRVAIDPMDALQLPVGSRDTHATARPVRMVRCDSCNGEGAHGNGQRCRYCDGQGKRPLHAFELRLDTADNAPSGDALVDYLDRRRDDEIKGTTPGSYRELELAMTGCIRHINKPLRFAAVTVYAHQALRLLDDLWLTREREYDALTTWQRDLVDLTIAYIDTRMPDPILVPKDVRANAKIRAERLTRAKGRGQSLKVRDAEIRKLARTHGPQWIAQQYGISIATVYRIANGKQAVA